MEPGSPGSIAPLFDNKRPKGHFRIMRLTHAIPILVLGTLLSLQTMPLQAEEWNFDSPTALGTPPPGWQNDSQAGSPATFRVEEFQETTSLYIRTAANTWNRVKTRTADTFQDGTYDWRIYVPGPWEEGASTSIGAFLYSPQSTGSLNAREIDFEIGYGRSAERSNYNIPAGRLMCYMTVQRDDASGTALSSIPYQPADPNDHIEPGNWYTFTIDLNVDSLDRYVVSWYIEKEGDPRVKGRPDYVAQYGPSGTYPTDFRIHCSVENFINLWIGDQQPAETTEAWFDYVSFSENTTTIDPPELPLITSIEEPDVTTAAFPPNPVSPSFPGTTIEGEWTRYGTAYAVISIEDNTAEAPDGDRYLSVSADWNAGNRVGVRFVPYGQPADWSGYPEIAFSLRSPQPTQGTTWQLAFFEQDGDIWISEDNPATETWTTQVVDLGNLIYEGSSTGDGVLNLQQIVMFGADFDNSSASSTQTFLIDNFHLRSPANSVKNAFSFY